MLLMDREFKISWGVIILKLMHANVLILLSFRIPTLSLAESCVRCRTAEAAHLGFFADLPPLYSDERLAF